MLPSLLLAPAVAMDFGYSDDEALPTHVDSTTGSIDADANTASTFRSSELTDRSVPIPEPPSPGTARKRGNAEIYEKPQQPLPSTTPLKPPPRPLPEDRTFTQPRTPSSVKVTFKDIQTPRPAPSPAQMAAVSFSTPGLEQQPAAISNTFVEDIDAYQKRLEAEFNEYELELKNRDRSQELAQLDWQALEDEYQKEIRNKVADEQMIMEDFEAHFAVSLLLCFFARLTVYSNSCFGCEFRATERVTEQSRGRQYHSFSPTILIDHRLRTRVAFVQNSESKLEERQEHCEWTNLPFRGQRDLH